MHELTADVAAARAIGASFLVVGFDAPAIARDARAGQFVNLLLRPGPLLRRPFSVYRVVGDLVEVIYRPVGAGTRQMAELRIGDRVSMLGPLGRGFDFREEWAEVALVSGGLGVAPMPLAARDAAASGLRVHWVHGARTAPELCEEWSGDEVVYATDDGSRGVHGSVVSAIPAGVQAVLACGPNAMLAAVAERFPAAQVALETYMGCGTGVCLGCAVPRTSGVYDRACSEGPVYPAGTIDWEALPSRLHYEAAG